MRNETVWKHKTKRFTVRLNIQRDYGYRYDGDDENEEIQALLDSGEYVAFDSTVSVELDGEEIASDSLGGSVMLQDTTKTITPCFGARIAGPIQWTATAASCARRKVKTSAFAIISRIWCGKR